jgi:hypothetical protein
MRREHIAFSAVSKLEHQLGQWFDTIMDRLSDIFARKTRVITVVVARRRAAD